MVVLFLSIASAFFRAFLNILDRKVAQAKNSDVLLISLANNVAPLIICLPFGYFLYRAEILEYVFSSSMWMIAASVQINAIVFVYAFKHMQVTQVGIWSKFPDIFLPFILLGLGFNPNIYDIVFSVATTVVFIGVKGFDRRGIIVSRPGMLIFASMIAHALVTSVLIEASVKSFSEMVAMGICIIFIRSIYTIFLSAHRILRLKGFSTISIQLIVPRAICTLLTQITFVAALSFGLPALSWPIFNMTSLIAMILAYFFLLERPHRSDIVLLIAMTLLTVVRASVG
jgi:hypothetical protein